MTASAADALALLAPDTPDTWPAGITAAADLREQRAEAVPHGPWSWIAGRSYPQRITNPEAYVIAETFDNPDLGAVTSEHIAAEANPQHVRFAVRRWRGTVERHRPIDGSGRPDSACFGCRYNGPWTGCPDLTEVADEARTYLGGSP